MADDETSNLTRVAAASQPLSLTHVFSAEIKVAPPQELGEVGGGRRRVIPILSGEVFGPRLQGKVLQGGSDWQVIRADGTALLVAKYTIQAPDGAVIGVINTGVRRGPPDVMARLAAGEVVDHALYYFRATPVFETGPGPHQWLTSSVFVCSGERTPDLVRLKVYELG